MQWVARYLVASACLVEYGHALPVGCQENSQCPTGFYCNQLFCHQCLECADLKRDPPRVSTPCVTSVTKCGPCFRGLVADKGNSGKCVPHSNVNDKRDQYLLPYEWAVIIVALLIAVVICVAAAYTLRHFHTFKILAYSISARRTSIELADKNNMLPASAEQPPPSYNVATTCTTSDNPEESHPFIQSVPPPRETGTLDYDEKQEAVLKSPPEYPDLAIPGPGPSNDSPSTSRGHVLPTSTSTMQESGSSGTDEQFLKIPEVIITPASPAKEEAPSTEALTLPRAHPPL